MCGGRRPPLVTPSDNELTVYPMLTTLAAAALVGPALTVGEIEDRAIERPAREGHMMECVVMEPSDQSMTIWGATQNGKQVRITIPAEDRNAVVALTMMDTVRQEQLATLLDMAETAKCADARRHLLDLFSDLSISQHPESFGSLEARWNTLREATVVCGGESKTLDRRKNGNRDRQTPAALLFTVDRNLTYTSATGPVLDQMLPADWDLTTWGKYTVQDYLRAVVGEAADDPTFPIYDNYRLALRGLPQVFETEIGGHDWTTHLYPVRRDGAVVGIVGYAFSKSDVFALTAPAVEQEEDESYLLTDAKAGVMGYNDAYVRAFGLPTKSLEAFRDWALANVTDPAAYIEATCAVFTSAEPATTRVEMLDGRVFDRYSHALFTPKGGVRGRAWYFTEVKAEAKRRVA